MGFSPVGVDLEPLAIERARAFAGLAGLSEHVQYVVSDIYALPFPAQAFDVVLDYGCLHHQKSPTGRATWR